MRRCWADKNYRFNLTLASEYLSACYFFLFVLKHRCGFPNAVRFGPFFPQACFVRFDSFPFITVNTLERNNSLYAFLGLNVSRILLFLSKQGNGHFIRLSLFFSTHLTTREMMSELATKFHTPLIYTSNIFL